MDADARESDRHPLIERDSATLDAARIAALRELGDGDVDLLRELFALFTSETTKHLAQLRRGLATGDGEAVSFAAHAIKGAAANLGATELARLCQQVDGGAQAGATDGLDALLDAVEREYELVESALAREIE